MRILTGRILTGQIMIEHLDLLLFLVTCILLMMGYPVAFTLAGSALVFALLGLSLGLFQVNFVTALPQRIFGTMTNEVLIAVPLFVFMGVMLERSRVAEELLDVMGKLFGTLRGGLGISVCIVGALLAASTGIVGATVVTMGLLSLPTMLKRNYDVPLATGIMLPPEHLARSSRLLSSSSCSATLSPALIKKPNSIRASCRPMQYRWVISSPGRSFPVLFWSASIWLTSWLLRSCDRRQHLPSRERKSATGAHCSEKLFARSCPLLPSWLRFWGQSWLA